MNVSTLANALAKSLSLVLVDAPSPKKKGGKRRGNPEALKRWRESQKAGEAAPAKRKAKPAAKAKAKPAVEGVECGPGEFRKGSETKAGREYVLIYVEGVYAGSIRVDDPAILKAAVATLAHKDAADAIELACE